MKRTSGRCPRCSHCLQRVHGAAKGRAVAAHGTGPPAAGVHGNVSSIPHWQRSVSAVDGHLLRWQVRVPCMHVMPACRATDVACRTSAAAWLTLLTCCAQRSRPVVASQRGLQRCHPSGGPAAGRRCDASAHPDTQHWVPHDCTQPLAGECQPVWCQSAETEHQQKAAEPPRC
jgi:hypothetical protein